MRREFAEKALAFVQNECKSKVEKAIRDVLGVRTSLVFGLNQIYNGDWVIDTKDEFDNVSEKMMANKLLRQLFAEVKLRIVIFMNDEHEEMGAYFGIGVDYAHGFGGGHNGHELMSIGIDKNGNVTLRK